MATINQSPAGQASVTLAGIGFDNLNASGTPFWESIKIVVGGSFSVSFGGGATAKQILLPASLRGKNTPISPTSASGIFNLDDQVAAKRADAWPS